MPGELQSLPPLARYLTISDGTPAAKVKIEARGYGKDVQRFMAIEKEVAPSVSETVIMPGDAAIVEAEDD
jgi:hypothetical protein